MQRRQLRKDPRTPTLTVKRTITGVMLRIRRVFWNLDVLNGIQTTYAYDRLGRTNQITTVKGHTTLLSLGYSYNSTGTVAGVVGTVNGAQVNEQYKYDQLRRLTNATVTSGGTSSGVATTHLWYQYDTSGNRIWQGINSTSTGNKWITTKYGINQANDELLNYTSSAGMVKYGYDADGNLVSSNVTGTSNWTYSWSVAGDLVSASNNTGVQGYYAYDGEGRRVEAKEGSTTIFYAYLGT